MSDLCLCGMPWSVSDNGHACVHCDTPGPGPHGPACQRCIELSTKCVICHISCGTPTAARSHEDSCRQTEARAERKALDAE